MLAWFQLINSFSHLKTANLKGGIKFKFFLILKLYLNDFIIVWEAR